MAALDWHPVTDMILSCGHDRNALVWQYDNQKRTYRPDLVIIPKQNRAALCITWNKKGDKFGMGTGTKKLFIGYFEQQNNWWNTLAIRSKINRR